MFHIPLSSKVSVVVVNLSVLKREMLEIQAAYVTHIFCNPHLHLNADNSIQHTPIRPPTAMPPRSAAAGALRFTSSILSLPHTGAASCLPPAYLVPLRQLQQRQQQRNASILSLLADNPGAYSKRIRKGRGPASGKGKTAGRGQKGQHAHGKVPAGFQGGQTPLEITKPARGRNAYNP